MVKKDDDDNSTASDTEVYTKRKRQNKSSYNLRRNVRQKTEEPGSEHGTESGGSESGGSDPLEPESSDCEEESLGSEDTASFTTIECDCDGEIECDNCTAYLDEVDDDGDDENNIKDLGVLNQTGLEQILIQMLVPDMLSISAGASSGGGGSAGGGHLGIDEQEDAFVSNLTQRSIVKIKSLIKSNYPELYSLSQKSSAFNAVKEILEHPNLYKEKKINLINKIINASSDERAKVLNTAQITLNVPTGVYKTSSVSGVSDDFLTRAKGILDSKIIGMNNVKEEILDFLCKITLNEYTGTVLGLEGPPGIGKCLAKDTEVLMYNNKIKVVQDIIPGDYLMGPDSCKRKVHSVVSGRELMYKIIDCVSGESYIVNKSHILSLKSKKNNKVVNISVTDYLNLPEKEKGMLVGYRKGILFNTTLPSIDTKEELETLLNESFETNKLHSRIKFGSKTARFTALSKLLYDHGHYFHIKSIAYIYSKNKDFLSEVRFLARSLGIDSYITDHITQGGSYQLYLYHPIFLKILVNYEYLSPNLVHTLDFTKFNDPMYTIEVQELCEDTYYGFELCEGPDRLFMLGDLSVTHNTRICRALGEILDLPFNQIAMGGINDSSILIGHDSTYVGAKPGKIVNTLIKSKCMNPIIYLDECFLASQLVVTNKGLVKISELVPGSNELLVKNYNIHSSKFEFSKVLFLDKKIKTELLHLQFRLTNTEDIFSVDCSVNHPFLTFYGYKRACELTGNDRILSENGVYHLTSMTTETGRFELYDITVKTNSNFIIKDAGHEYLPGIIVHNCDKISEHKSDEINGVLTHLLDEEQNKQFHDNFLEEFDLDLSKVLFVLSYNDPEKLNPIVKNRIKTIKVTPPTNDEKMKIVKELFIPDYVKQLYISKYNVVISDENLKYLMSITQKEPGMRKIKKNTETILNKLNTKMMIKETSSKLEQNSIGMIYEKLKIEVPAESNVLEITKDHINLIIYDKLGRDPEDWRSMYS